jgi:hypothetical protein
VTVVEMVSAKSVASEANDSKHSLEASNLAYVHWDNLKKVVQICLVFLRFAGIMRWDPDPEAEGFIDLDDEFVVIEEDPPDVVSW